MAPVRAARRRRLRVQAQTQTSADSTGLALTAIGALGEDAQAAPWRKRQEGSGEAADAAGTTTEVPDVRGHEAAERGIDEECNPGARGLAYPVPAGRAPPKKQPKRRRSPGRPAPARRAANRTRRATIRRRTSGNADDTGTRREIGQERVAQLQTTTGRPQGNAAVAIDRSKRPEPDAPFDDRAEFPANEQVAATTVCRRRSRPPVLGGPW